MLNKPDGTKGKYIPYRESKLTSLLRHSLGGNSYCLMIACISPSSKFYNENVSTLNYASKASCISNKPTKNHDPKNKVIKDLKKEVQSLRQQLMMAHNLYGNNENICPKCSNPMEITPSSSLNELPLRARSNSSVERKSGTPASRLQQIPPPELPDFKKMFEKNEAMMDLMTEDIMSLKEIMSAQNKLGLFERILLSAKMVKNVLMRNMELNKDYMDHTLQIDDLQKQVSQLQLENEDIRERLSIMEALTGTDSYYISMNYSSIKEEFPAELPKNKKDMIAMLDQDKMIALIYEYNKENTILKNRIERFEKKKIKNKFMQISDGMNKTSYTSAAHNLSHSNYILEQRKEFAQFEDEDQSFPLGYRCSTSPRFIPKDSDAEPIRCVIDAHEIPHMNLS